MAPDALACFPAFQIKLEIFICHELKMPATVLADVFGMCMGTFTISAKSAEQAYPIKQKHAYAGQTAVKVLSFGVFVGNGMNVSASAIRACH